MCADPCVPNSATSAEGTEAGASGKENARLEQRMVHLANRYYAWPHEAWYG